MLRKLIPKEQKNGPVQYKGRRDLRAQKKNHSPLRNGQLSPVTHSSSFFLIIVIVVLVVIIITIVININNPRGFSISQTCVFVTT